MSAQSDRYDVVVIGAGIIGCLVARELTRYKLKVAVLERANDIGEGASKATSGVVYTSLHKRAKSLKAISCLEGNRMYDQLTAQLDIPFKRTGSLFCAFKDKELLKLEDKHKVALARGHQDVRLLSGQTARQQFEPQLNPDVLQALYLPQTGIIDPFQLIWASAQSAQANGAQFIFDTAVTDVKESVAVQDGYDVMTGHGVTYQTRFVLNAAGDNAAKIDRLYHSSAARICALRGQYLIFDKQRPSRNGSKVPITHVLHQAGESDRGGILLAPTVAGNLLAGPVSQTNYVYGDTATTAVAQNRIKKAVGIYVGDFDFGTAITGFAGNRANFENVEFEQKDFIVRACAPRFVSILGINTPGMTAAPYLARHAVGVLAEQGLELEPNPSFKPQRIGFKPFINCDSAQQNELLAKSREFANVICRCENITCGDVRAITSQPLPPKTLDGYKKRLRIGMGRCHGAYCTARLLKFLDREGIMAVERMVKNRPNSYLVSGRLK